jgi:hypothetical protein
MYIWQIIFDKTASFFERFVLSPPKNIPALKKEYLVGQALESLYKASFYAFPHCFLERVDVAWSAKLTSNSNAPLLLRRKVSLDAFTGAHSCILSGFCFL